MRRSKKKDFSKVIKKQNKSWFHRLVSGAFLAPSVLGVLLFFVLPFLVVIYFSFVNNPVAKKFVGLTNYINVIQNGAFRTAVGNTLFFSVVAVPLAVILGMALAFLLDAGIPLKSELRSCFLTPLMVPTASIVLIWQVLFDYNGVVNVAVQKFGGGQVDWLKSSAGLLVIILLFLWKNLGYNMILFLSAMGNIPKDIIEVAELDGANRWQIFLHVKLRYLSPTIMFVTILSMINSFKVFREIYLLTGEYPYGALYMLQHYMNNTFASAETFHGSNLYVLCDDRHYGNFILGGTSFWKGFGGRMKKRSERKKLCIRICLTVIAVVTALIFIMPIVLTISNSFMSAAEITSNYGSIFQKTDTGGKQYISQTVNLKFIPDMVTFSQYATVLFKSPDYLLKFWNSVILVVPIVVFQLVVAVLAAYGFTRTRGKLSAIVFFAYVILMMMPYQVTLVPNYLVLNWMKLLDTNWSIWLPGIFSPFSVYLITKYMRRIPVPLIEAAKIDGANEFQVFTKICIPICKGVITTCAILVFMDYWNMVEQPLLFFNDTDKYPLSIFLSKINAQEVGLAFAVATFYMIPSLLIFLYGEDQLVEGIAYQGGVKG